MNESLVLAEETVVQSIARVFASTYGFPEAIERAEDLGRLGKENGLMAGYLLMMEVVDCLMALRQNPPN